MIIKEKGRYRIEKNSTDKERCLDDFLDSRCLPCASINRETSNICNECDYKKSCRDMWMRYKEGWKK